MMNTERVTKSGGERRGARAGGKPLMAPVTRRSIMKAKRVVRGTAARRGARAGDKRLSAPVTLFAAIEAEQHEALRAIAFSERRSLADVVRRALNAFFAAHPSRRRLVAAKR
jgi:hypothetical protein